MAAIPAHCEDCNLFFPMHLMIGEISFISFKGSPNFPCLRCGGRATILDGVYEVAGNAVKLLSASPRSKSKLDELLSLLQAAQKQNISPEELKSTIKEQIPELAKLSDILPTTRNELYNFVIMLCAIIGAIILVWPKDRALTPQEQAEILDRAIIKMATMSAELQASTPTPTPTPSPTPTHDHVQRPPKPRRK